LARVISVVSRNDSGDEERTVRRTGPCI